MAFNAREYLTFFGVKGIKQARKGNLLAHCPDFDGLHPNGDRRRSFGILEEPKWDPHTLQWVPAGTSNCFVCGGMSLETLTAKFLSQNLGRPVSELEAYSWLEEKGWLPEEDLEEMQPESLVNFLSGLGYEDEVELIQTYDVSVLDNYLKALHPMALQRGNTKNAISIETARDVFKLGYCENSRRTVIPVFTRNENLIGVISRATRKDDFIRYGIGVPDSTYPEKGWKMVLDFQKSEIMYGEWLWNRFKHNTLLVIESPLDVVYAYEQGLFEHMDVGAIFGAKPSEIHLKKMAEYEYVVEGLDQDNAGREGAKFMIERLQKMGSKILTFDSYGNKDLGECTPDQVKNAIHHFKELRVI